MHVTTPVSQEVIDRLQVGQSIYISGHIFAGRDAVLPLIARLAEGKRLAEHGLSLTGGVVFHTAVSAAGIGPTTSNKVEIEESIPALSSAGIKIHMGKGQLSEHTVSELQAKRSIFVVTPPVTALLSSCVKDKTVLAFPELGMEAFYRLTVDNVPAMVAIAHGQSIFSRMKGSADI